MILGFAIEQLQKMQDLLRDRFFVVPEKALQVEQHVDVRWLEQSSIDQVSEGASE
jgi:hypothetical protein